jgi:translation initiation factor IF-2
LSTVRIYKVAELLGTTSQEVTALLKRDHGIEVKSASSTIEEVVARQFVDRMARQRNIALPTGDIFAETPVVKGKKPVTAKKAPEPPKPMAPPLPPPRLVKTIKPVVPVAEAPEADAAVAVEEPIAPPAFEPVVEEASPPEPEFEVTESPAATTAPEAEAPAGAEVTAKSVHGRVVPPTIRLRIEQERPTTPTPPLPTQPAPRVAPRPVARPQVPPVAARPAAPAAPSGAGTARPPASQRPAYTGPTPRPTPGGPRPLPSQPIRTQQPGGPARPGQYQPGVPPRPGQPYPQRPGMPSRPPFRPAGPRPTAGQRREQSSRPAMPSMPAAPPPVTRTITLAEGLTVKDLAAKLDIMPKEVLAKLLMKRLMMTINQTLDTETATMIAREFGADVQMRSFEEELQVDTVESNPEDVVTRAPVVTVMGHVDHGKTSLLDAIREARVAEREAGGITQHIGAYHVTINGRDIVFLDTPGHEAFTLMRARGAKVTDIVILVVAADDGVMPQTREAIDHARAANVPIIVAINKIDKPNASPERVKRELTDLDLMPEEWGGTTVTVDVSAKKKQNLDLLLEMVLLVSEIGELKANPKRHATGTVLEAKLDKGRGPVATVLVQDGTLSVGDTFIAAAGGRVPGRRRRPRASDCRVPRGAGQEQGTRRQGRTAHARVAAGTDCRRRHEGAADHHQGRRAGLG